MTLDFDTCYRAVLARDPRFDGRFFTAVTSTGIYCRPVCPARTPARGNMRFYPHAGAAEAAGHTGPIPASIGALPRVESRHDARLRHLLPRGACPRPEV